MLNRIQLVESQKTNDVQIIAHFIPDADNPIALIDSACLTVIKTEFMLTFDDGPFAEKTMKVVDDLANFYVNGEKVKAAFFMVGEDGSGRKLLPFPDPFSYEGIDDNPGVAEAVSAIGHFIGNHTQHHKYLADETKESVINEIDLCEAVILDEFGVFPNQKIFRPPYWINTQAVRDGASEMNYKIIWGVSGFGEIGFWDWQSVAKKTMQYLEQWNIKKEPNEKDKPAILCYHEWHDPIPDYMDEIVEYIQDKGFVLNHFNPDLCVGDKDYYTNEN